MSERPLRERDPELDRLQQSVSRFGERRRRWGRDRRRILSTALAVAGLGWLVVVPAAVGFIIGHRLDRRFGSGIEWAAGLGLLGLVLGCYSAWSRIAHHGFVLERDRATRPDPLEGGNNERGADHG